MDKNLTTQMPIVGFRHKGRRLGYTHDTLSLLGPLKLPTEVSRQQMLTHWIHGHSCPR